MSKKRGSRSAKSKAEKDAPKKKDCSTKHRSKKDSKKKSQEHFPRKKSQKQSSQSDNTSVTAGKDGDTGGLSDLTWKGTPVTAVTDGGTGGLSDVRAPRIALVCAAPN